MSTQRPPWDFARDRPLEVAPTFQNFWRCEHHPIAIENFFGQWAACEWRCDRQPLLWHHNGQHQPRPFVPYRIDF